MATKQKVIKKIGVILMTYGSPTTLDEVPAYLKNVYGGKDASQEVITEFRRRYQLIGGSPLIKITKEQAAALENELNKKKTNMVTFRVAAGMRFSDPFIKDVVRDLGKEVDKIIGIIMSPQYSPIIMSGYEKELEQAVKAVNPDIPFTTSTDWHLQPYFIEAMAEKVQQTLDTFSPKVKKSIPVLFSAHSMPKRVIEKEPDYINHLKETAAAIANKAGLSKKRWMFCYQSAGHTPEEWLKPDFADIMPELQKKGQTHVLIAPVQFLADHLEILYDVGIGAREQAEEHGIVFARTESLNASPKFIKALAAVVKDLLY